MGVGAGVSVGCVAGEEFGSFCSSFDSLAGVLFTAGSASSIEVSAIVDWLSGSGSLGSDAIAEDAPAAGAFPPRPLPRPRPRAPPRAAFGGIVS